uniref:Uncharacterized protein n=1 Tax=Romanomermis culicivorax TaxID=13658 RepID=A0A915HTV4_ROMCU
MRLPKLKSLSLYIDQFNTHLDEDFDLPYHRIINDLYFVSLQNILIDCGNLDSHAKFVAFLLTRSPLLKEFSLSAVADNLPFYRILFDKFPLYDRIEIFTIPYELTYEVQSFIYNELSKMMNLKYFCLNSRFFRFEDVQKVSELRKLKFLHWSARNAAALKIIRSSCLFNGIYLYDIQKGSPASIELILHQCPNLRYFSVDVLNGEQMRKLPLKAPNLQYLQLRNNIVGNSSTDIVSIIAYLVENLPNLRQLSVHHKLYNLLLQHKPMKRLCRRKRLSVITDRFWRSQDDLIIEWIHRSCQEDPPT